MRYVILAVVVVVLAARVGQRYRSGVRGWNLLVAGRVAARRRAPAPRRRARGADPLAFAGPIGLVAHREIRERVKSRVFRIGTVVVLLVVAAGIVIPVVNKGKHRPVRVGVVGSISPEVRQTVIGTGRSVGSTVVIVDETNLTTAESDLKAGRIALVLVDAERIVVNKPISASDTSSDASFVRLLSSTVSLQHGLEEAGIDPAKAASLAHPAPLPVASLQQLRARSNGTARATAVYGLILIYILLTQYGTWVMMGVVEEKSSRVVEVLLSAIRPAQLLAGKVIGIGAVALIQSAVIVAVALGLAEAVRSELVRGAAPVEVLSILLWVVLGYANYCWVWAAGGALADRQEHVQSLVFPLQIPVLFGYITALTSVGSSTASPLIHVLAYVPLTSPFAMNVLVADNAVTWWQYLLSVAVTLGATVLVARLASTIYVRAVLRTGRRVKLREVLDPAAA